MAHLTALLQPAGPRSAAMEPQPPMC